MEKIKKYIQTIPNFIELHSRIIFSVILFLAITLNIYRFGEVPSGINCDEAGMTYDAYCIANYGTDRFDNRFPVYFINYGDGQNALYTYLTAILIKIFGYYNVALIRIPNLILSIIEVIVAYLLVKKFKGKKLGLLFMLLVTISPWHIMKSRWGLESYLLSPLLLFSVYALMCAISDENKKMLKYFISGLLFGITLYTYAISYIAIPVFLLLMFLYLLKLKKIKLKEILIFSIPLVILAIPLILMLMVQKGWIGEIHSFITIPKLLRFRQNELSLSHISENVATLKYGLWEDKLNYNSLPGFGVLYYCGTFLMVVGLVIQTLKFAKTSTKKNLDLSDVMLFLFISNIIIGFLTDMCANKINGIYISATYFELVAIKYLYYLKKWTLPIIVTTYTISFVMFIHMYFTDFVYSYKPYWDNYTTEVFEYIKKYGEKPIYTDDILYIYNIYANPIHPKEFNESKIIKNREVVGYKNYYSIIPEENFDMSGIYITPRNCMAEKIQEATGMKMEKYKYYYILYGED